MKVKIKGAETLLERHVQKWINGEVADYENGAAGVIDDLLRCGCQSGFVGHLIYYKDTLAFFKKHRQEINSLLKELIDGTGYGPEQLFRDWDKEDPLALDTSNQNLLAWFGFEETARKLADRNGIEV